MPTLKSLSPHEVAYNLKLISSIRSTHREIDPTHNAGDEDLLNQIGYKQELDRRYSTLQVFGIAYSIMGLLPSISSVISLGLASGPAGFTWGWFVSGVFILCTGASLTVLGSAIPTSGGLYYYTYYFAPKKFAIPVSFVIGCSNSIGLCGGICAIAYGFATEVLSAVFINQDGNFEITNARLYGIFAACILSNVLVCSLATRHTAILQTVSILVNSFLIFLFYVAVPSGAVNSGFNDSKFIFGTLQNYSDWSQGWQFMLSWLPAIWTICAFDSVIHCSEEAKNAQRAVPYGILGSIITCWILGWLITVIASACIKDGDVDRVLTSSTGNAMAQLIYDALGKKWAVAFMALIAVGQYFMCTSIFIAASRQIWAFSRDDGLPVIYNFIKVINPLVRVPIRATVLAGVICLLLGLLVLIGEAGSGALFSLGVASMYFSWGTPVLIVLLPEGRSRFRPGPFYFGKLATNIIHGITVIWIVFVIIMMMFPASKTVDKDSMNYTCVINVGVWILSLIYYYSHGYKVYIGPKSNLESFVGQPPLTEIKEVFPGKE